MPDDQPLQSNRVWLWVKTIALVVAVIVGGLFGLGLYDKYVWLPLQYPYGRSHCCDAIVWSTLWMYATAHDGEFPSGEVTPEATLSVLARKPWNLDAEILRGKSIPKDVVEEKLARGELLDPEKCGWNYVEGLRSDDDSRIAILWDKAGLGHNGERLSGGGHIVTRIHGDRDHIRASQWSDFLKEQKTLLNALPEDRQRLALRSFPK